jgi:hypothetical protein
VFVRADFVTQSLPSRVVFTNLEESEHGDGADDQSDRGGLGYASVDGLLGGGGGFSAAGSHGCGAVAGRVRCWCGSDRSDWAGLESRRNNRDGRRVFRGECRR